MHPPPGVIEPYLLRRALRLRGVFKDRETGRPRPRHPRQPGPVGGVERRDHFTDHGLNAGGRGFEVVGIGSEDLDPVLDRGARFRPVSGLDDIAGADQQFSVAQTKRGEHVLGRHGNARIDQHARYFRQAHR